MIYLLQVKSMHIPGPSQTSFYSLLTVRYCWFICSYKLATDAHLLWLYSTRPKTSCIKRDDGILGCILMPLYTHLSLLAYRTMYCLFAYFVRLVSTYLIYMNYLFGLDESGFALREMMASLPVFSWELYMHLSLLAYRTRYCLCAHFVNPSGVYLPYIYIYIYIYIYMKYELSLWIGSEWFLVAIGS